MSSKNPFNLLELERAVQCGDYVDAADRVKSLITAMDSADLQMSTSSDDETRKGFSRWVRAISSLLAAPGFEPTADFFRNVVLRKRVLVDMFATSEYDNMDGMLGAVVCELEKTGDWGLSALRRILLTYSLDTDVEFDITNYLKEAPDEVAHALIGLLAIDVVLTERVRKLRRDLTENVRSVSDMDFPFDTLKFLAQPWFLSSYDDWEGKHEVKVHLNEAFKRVVASHGISAGEVADRNLRKDRPTVLLPLERFRSTHAMYRCWAPAIRQLRERFRLVAACNPSWLDEHSASIFDEVIDLRFDQQSLSHCIERVSELSPDMVYYPSVGMSAEIIAMANLRLAPIQIMTFGHPGTSMSDTMDYAVMEELQLGDPSLLNETVALLRDGSCQMEMRHDAASLAPDIRLDPEPVRVAVPSTYFKLNPAFLDVCRRIAEKSNRDVEYHFFPSAIGPRLHHVRRRVRDIVPGATVYASTSYPEFVKNLNSCDLQLAPFPFGNANSNLDALRQGLPILTLDGGEVHSRIDGALLRVLGAPDWLITSSVSAYIDTAVRLVDDHTERVDTSRQILSCDLERAHYDNEYLHTHRDFVDLFWWLYLNHDAIKEDGRKVWTPEMRGSSGLGVFR